MVAIEDLTGQTQALTAVNALASEQGRRSLLVIGPPGSGKTWLSRISIGRWAEKDLPAVGTPGGVFQDRPLHPWLRLLASRPGRRRYRIAARGLAAGAKGVPVAGPLLSFIIGEVATSRRKRFDVSEHFLDEREQAILFALANAAADERLLIALDDVDLWDPQSTDLLSLLLQGDLDGIYPSLANVVVLMTARDASAVRVRGIGSAPIQLTAVDARSYAAVLSALGATAEVDTKTAASLEVVCGGNLHLLSEVARHIPPPANLKEYNLEESVVQELLDRRISALIDHDEALVRTLACAATVGAEFTLDEINCLLADATELESHLRRASSGKLVTGGPKHWAFASPLVRDFFVRATADERASFHRKFGECLRVLRPADYSHRLLHARAAGDDTLAEQLRALEFLAELRRGRADGQELAALRLEGSVSEFVQTMAKAHRAYEDRELEVAIELLRQIEPFLSEPLLGEKDYLMAQALLKRIDRVSMSQAHVLLEARLPHVEAEPELWSRIAQLLFVVLVNLRDFTKAKSVEECLARYFWGRKSFDPSALYGWNCLRRRAEMLYQLPVARHRLEQAAEFFGPANPGGPPRHPVQYYYTLNNLLANCLVGGDVGKGAAAGHELQALMSSSPDLRFPGLVIPANNLILLAFLRGELNASEARTNLSQVLPAATNDGDALLMHNNAAVLDLLAGNEKEGTIALESMMYALPDDADPYHRYFVVNNLAGALAVAGDHQKARALFASAKSLSGEVYPAIKVILERRHAMVTDMLNRSDRWSATDWYNILAHERPQVSEGWSFYGRGFLMSDIQFWSAD